ncbi:hypothetical protein Tco_0370948 [Tanacetum coccineum]
MSAKSKIINNVRHITAKVAGKPMNISEASIRSALLFDDADGIDSLNNQAIFDAIQLMGYVVDFKYPIKVSEQRDDENVVNYQYIYKPATTHPKWELLEFDSHFRKLYVRNT